MAGVARDARQTRASKREANLGEFEQGGSRSRRSRRIYASVFRTIPRTGSPCPRRSCRSCWGWRSKRAVWSSGGPIHGANRRADPPQALGIPGSDASEASEPSSGTSGISDDTRRVRRG